MSIDLLVPEERVQLVYPRLAAKIGLPESIVAAQLFYWTRKMDRDWIHNTIEEWTDQLPYLSPRTVRRAFASLRDQKLVEVQQQKGSNRVNSYRLRRDRILKLVGSDWPDGSGHIDPVEAAKLASSIDGTESTSGENPPTPKGGEQVRDIFEFWQKHHSKPQHQLTDKRRRKVQQRLKEECNLSAPYSPERVREIKEAVYGCRYSDHHMGRKPDSTRAFNDLELICRNRDQIDTFRELFQQNRPKEQAGVDVNARRKEVRKAQGLDDAATNGGDE